MRRGIRRLRSEKKKKDQMITLHVSLPRRKLFKTQCSASICGHDLIDQLIHELDLDAEEEEDSPWSAHNNTTDAPIKCAVPLCEQRMRPNEVHALALFSCDYNPNAACIVLARTSLIRQLLSLRNEEEEGEGEGATPAHLVKGYNCDICDLVEDDDLGGWDHLQHVCCDKAMRVTPTEVASSDVVFYWLAPRSDVFTKYLAQEASDIFVLVSAHDTTKSISCEIMSDKFRKCGLTKEVHCFARPIVPLRPGAYYLQFVALDTRPFFFYFKVNKPRPMPIDCKEPLVAVSNDW